MKVRLTISAILILFTVSYAFYLFKYQQLINEASFLADEHCIVINPLIIERKKAYIDSIKTLLKEDGKDSYLAANEKYQQATKLYMAKEKEWLNRQYDFLHRWDFRTFMDTHVQEAANWQYKAYQAEYDSSEAVVKLWNAESEQEQKFFSDLIVKKTKEQTEAEEKYQAMWDNRSNRFDIRDFIIRIPPSQCPAKNYDIPDVRKELGF